ncbi:MAG: hypothetical protein OEZ09_13765 [Betaproteobacteria bacterium]|nr:hypothetical protein [Betaproteobacteria bacterium]MDH5579510.1 hypothetical protein [Betaproteobacteria bacterium]
MNAISATPGLLSVWNDIDAADEAEFNAWYQGEHLGERLALPGILSARRYAEIGRPRSYAAIYDTDGLGALGSPAYLERLANPTPRTRAIMPRFRNMVRAASTIAADCGALRTAGAVLAVLELAAAPDAAGRRALEANAGACRVRLAIPDPGATQVPNPEAKMRSAPDRLPAPFVLVEGADEATVRAAAGKLARVLGAPRPARLYALLEARTREPRRAL